MRCLFLQSQVFLSRADLRTHDLVLIAAPRSPPLWLSTHHCPPNHARYGDPHEASAATEPVGKQTPDGAANDGAGQVNGS